MKPGRKYCTVGRLSHEVGWKYQDVVARSVFAQFRQASALQIQSPANDAPRLEERRKIKGAAYYERKRAISRQLAEAKRTANVGEKTSDQLAEYGY